METQPHHLGPSRLLGGNPSPLTPLHQTMSFACLVSLNTHKALFPLQMGRLRHSTFPHITSPDQVLGAPWYLPAHSTPLRSCVQRFRSPKCSTTDICSRHSPAKRLCVCVSMCLCVSPHAASGCMSWLLLSDGTPSRCAHGCVTMCVMRSLKHVCMCLYGVSHTCVFGQRA